jgi:hypothetical protein
MYSATPAALIKLEEFENDKNIQPKKLMILQKFFQELIKLFHR